jgi:PilZ domain-containing protein
MERRIHPRTEVQFETRVTDLKMRQQACMGRTCNISESGISVLQPLPLAPDDLVQLEMADSVAVGRVVYSNPEGAQFRVGIEVQRIQMGDSDLSNLLRRTLMETMPSVPGVEHAETYPS